MTFWGIVALCCWSAAVFMANASALVPANVLAGLHASRLEGATINQLWTQLSSIAAESDRMRRENNLLLQRLDLAQQAQGEVTRRVGALEISLPRIAERIPESAPIDNSVTASITDGTAVIYDADGGSVRVVQKPLVAIEAGAAAAGRPIVDAPEILADGSHYGIALGFPVALEDGEVLWQDLMAKVGTLLIGLWPVIADVEGSDGQIIVAGPLPGVSQAAELCGRLDKVGIPCKPAPFLGEPLPLLN